MSLGNARLSWVAVTLMTVASTMEPIASAACLPASVFDAFCNKPKGGHGHSKALGTASFKTHLFSKELEASYQVARVVNVLNDDGALAIHLKTLERFATIVEGLSSYTRAV